MSFVVSRFSFGFSNFQQDVDVNFFAVGWFQTLFLYTSRMPSDTLLWLWDVWVTERSYKVSMYTYISLF